MKDKKRDDIWFLSKRKQIFMYQRNPLLEARKIIFSPGALSANLNLGKGSGPLDHTFAITSMFKGE